MIKLKIKKTLCVCIFFISFLVVLFSFLTKPFSVPKTSRLIAPNNSILCQFNKSINSYSSSSYGCDNVTKAPEKPQEFVLAIVVCGDRVKEAFVSIKSAIVFKSTMTLKVIIFTEDSLKQSFEEKLSEWAVLTNGTFSFEIHPVSFPPVNEEEWRKLFKLCSSQRLFFPDLLPHVDSLLYVDTDTTFLTPLPNVWRHFSLMNSSQFAALAPEHEDPNVGWYNRFAQHPFYGELGVNSGVMLMNLTRMRSSGWTKYLAPIFQEFKRRLTWGDQDIINIIFYYHPEYLYVYPCSYNYRPDHCMYTSVCWHAEKNGVHILHGSRSSFHTDRQVAFKLIFQAFQEYQLGTDPYQNLLLPLVSYLETVKDTLCGQLREAFTRIMKNFIPQKFPYR